MKVAIVGGGPAGLYTALLLKKANPAHEVSVFERNRFGETFGWGVVFSDQTLENFRLADEPTYRQITDHFAHWDNIDVVIHGRRITSGGHGFSGIARKQLLHILEERARDVGVALHFEQELPSDAIEHGVLRDMDVVIAADGVNSAIRRTYADAFVPDLDQRSARYIWLGTTLPLDAFTFFFVETAHGVFQAHCYRFDDQLATFIVECDEASWRSAGFDRMDTDETIGACEAMFAPWLQGHRLMSNATHRAASPWVNFLRVRNARWFHENIVLIGDAAHTAHFSIGSGTKLAMEDAIALARALSEMPAEATVPGRPVSRAALHAALRRYQDERMTESLRLQNAARNSMEWFEHVKRYIHLEPEQFAYSLLTRSQRVSHENLRLRDTTYLSGVERWFAARASETAHVTAPTGNQQWTSTATVIPESAVTTTPPMFTPFRLRDMVLDNRIVLSPMAMYCATDGTPTDFHLVHLGERALGGAALVVTEMTCVSPEGRITPGCPGMYAEAHVTAWRRIVDFVHTWSASRIALQLGHSGRKGSTRVPWEGTDRPLAEGNWPLMAPSAIPYAEGNQVPRPMTRADMDEVRDAFVRATQMAVTCGFDMVELHCAHGYLLSSFLTPVSNERTDEYGGSLEHRLRYPLEVFRAMRAVWPAERPMSVRISATDWVTNGITGEESVAIAKAFVDAGADIIHVSTGQTTSAAQPVFGRLFQTPYSDRIRNEGGMPTIAVGNITEPDQVNSIIAAGRADLCAIGRPHLSDPHWTLHAAAQLGVRDVAWPKQYYQGRTQLERETRRKQEMTR